MKKLITLLFTLLSLSGVWAQAPQKMSYQAVIRNGFDKLIVNQMVGMRICILQGSGSGTAVYTETQNPTTNANGLVTIEIGAGSSNDNFSSIDWANGPYFIQTETDPAGGSGYSISGASQLLSVPYALYAQNAETVTGDNWGTQAASTDETLVGNGTMNSPLQIAPQGAASGQVLKWNG